MYHNFLADLGMEKDATEMVKAVGYCAVIVLYYLLLVGEYTVKNKEMKQGKRCNSSWKIHFFLLGWKGVYVYQEHNVDEKFIPVRSLGGRFVSIRDKVKNKKTYLS